MAVENLTTRHFQLNGVYWNSVNGYRASYVSAYANGDYGSEVSPFVGREGAATMSFQSFGGRVSSRTSVT